MSLIEEANLMKLNRESLVEAINSLGFCHVDETTPMQKLAVCVKWATGLLDLRLATINKRTNEYVAYSAEEWDQLSASDKSSRIKLGIQIRAEGMIFIISKEHALRDNGTGTMPWCQTSNINVRGLTDYGAGSWGFHTEDDAERNTDLILAYGQENNFRFDAAERARAYKASSFADGGYDDPTIWSLPTMRQLLLMYKYKLQIVAAMTLFGFEGFYNEYYWSCIEFNTTYAWLLLFYNGNTSNNSKTTSYRVRPVAPVPAPAMETL